ncbi:MAG: DNA recombination/repair protein RecA [Clostridium sp.]|nr:DNA recombination/repair protein RecA [Clostridium sp.]
MSSYADIIKKKSKEWECPGLMDAARAVRGDKIPFSSPLMNWCTYGGIPRYKITEFFGEPGGGKTTTAVDICKNAIEIFHNEYNAEIDRLREEISKGSKTADGELEDLTEIGPKKVLYIDLEHAFDGKWAETLGISKSDMDIMQPPNVVAEDILQTLQEIVETGEVGLVVLDSIPSLVTQKELEKKYGGKNVAPLAGLLTIFFRKIISLLTRYKCTLLMINQIRDNLNNPYVVSTPGGRAPKFYASLRIQFRIGKPVDFLGNELPMNTENPAGYLVVASLVKQKSAPWDRKQGTYYLMCQSGIRPDFDYALLAINKYNIIQKSGAWFTVCDPYTGEVLMDNTLDKPKPIKLNGLAKVYDFLNSHQEYYQKVQKFILDDINGKTDINEPAEGSDYEYNETD